MTGEYFFVGPPSVQVFFVKYIKKCIVYVMYNVQYRSVQDIVCTLYNEQCVQYTWKNEAVGAGGCLCSRILIGLGTV